MFRDPVVPRWMHLFIGFLDKLSTKNNVCLRLCFHFPETYIYIYNIYIVSKQQCVEACSEAPLLEALHVLVCFADLITRQVFGRLGLQPHGGQAGVAQRCSSEGSGTCCLSDTQAPKFAQWRGESSTRRLPCCHKGRSLIAARKSHV